MRAFTYKDRMGIEHTKTSYRKGCKGCIETQCGCFLPFRRNHPIKRKCVELDKRRKLFW